MSLMEVIRSEGPLKKDWEVYLHTAQHAMVTLECFKVPMTEEEKVVAVKARVLGMMRIYRRVPYGNAKTQELCFEKMTEFIADGVMDKEEDREEEE